MKNTVPFILSLLFFLPSDLQAQVKKYVFGDSIFVWASSLNMRERPSPDAKVVGKVPYGSAVVVVDDSIGKVAYKFKAVAEDTLDSGEKTKPFYLHGFWVKVNFDGMVGYVFDGYLSKVKPLESLTDEPWENVVDWAKQALKLKVHQIDYLDRSVPEYGSIKSGIRIRYGDVQGSGFTEIRIRGIQFEEAAILGLKIFGGGLVLDKSSNRVRFGNSKYELCKLTIAVEENCMLISFWCYG